MAREQTAVLTGGAREIAPATGKFRHLLLIGIGIFVFLTYYAWKGRYTPKYYTPVEMGGLYWHFVDIVWIYLFPLLYLIDRHR